MGGQGGGGRSRYGPSAEDYVRTLRHCIRDDLQFIAIILHDKNEALYSAVKRLTTVESPSKSGCTLILPMLRLLLSKAQERKDF